MRSKAKKHLLEVMQATAIRLMSKTTTGVSDRHAWNVVKEEHPELRTKQLLDELYDVAGMSMMGHVMKKITVDIGAAEQLSFPELPKGIDTGMSFLYGDTVLRVFTHKATANQLSGHIRLLERQHEADGAVIRRWKSFSDKCAPGFKMGAVNVEEAMALAEKLPPRKEPGSTRTADHRRTL